MNEPPTVVIFRMWDGEVIAVFPEIPGNPDPSTCSSYQHVGQHATCSPSHIIAKSRPAKPEEYAALKKELESPPYEYKLKVGVKITRFMNDARMRALKESRQ